MAAGFMHGGSAKAGDELTKWCPGEKPGHR